MTGPLDNTPELHELIRPLVEYQARAGRQVTFVWPAKIDMQRRTIIYALHPTKPKYETDEPVFQAKGRRIFFAWLAAGLITEVSTTDTPNWGPVFQLTHNAELAARQH
jgi:hypothetical protein